MKITHKPDYRLKRAAAYPPLQEFADALYWQERGDPAPMAAYLAKCDAVKQRYPKPRESDHAEPANSGR